MYCMCCNCFETAKKISKVKVHGWILSLNKQRSYIILIFTNMANLCCSSYYIQRDTARRKIPYYVQVCKETYQQAHTLETFVRINKPWEPLWQKLCFSKKKNVRTSSTEIVLVWTSPPPHPLHPCRTSRLTPAPPLVLPLKLVLQWITTIIYKEISQGINLLSGLVNTGRIWRKIQG